MYEKPHQMPAVEPESSFVDLQLTHNTSHLHRAGCSLSSRPPSTELQVEKGGTDP